MNPVSDSTKQKTILPRVVVIEDSTEPSEKPNEIVLNKSSLIVLLEFALNQLEMKKPVKVVDIRVGISGATVEYRKVEG